MAEMSKTKELLAWQFAWKVITEHSDKHPLERMRNINTMETADGLDAAALIMEQIKRLVKEVDNG